MSIRTALCTACCKPLNGDLVASACNHVFHRRCLSEDLKECPKCRREDVSKSPLLLFGVNFDEGRDSDSAAVVAALYVGTAGCVDVEESEVVKFVAEICTGRAARQRHQQELADLHEQVSVQCAEAKKQHDKHQQAKRVSTKRSTERAQLEAQIKSSTQEHESLTAKMHQLRQRDTVLEYVDWLRNRSNAEALTFLTRMVDLVGEPWKILVEIARLRDDMRTKLDKFQRDSMAQIRRERELSSLLAERERRVSHLQKELAKQRSNLQGVVSQTAVELAPGLKRRRTSD